jgi:hypothetical protein
MTLLFCLRPLFCADNRGGGGGYGGSYGGGERKERKPVGYRCRIMGLARDVGWQ